MTPRKRHRRFFFFLFVSLLIGALSGVVMMLWNAILTDVLNAKPITYPQALGLFILCRILFGSFRLGGTGRSPWKKHRRGRWSNLSQEEKTRLKEEWRKRCNR
ncbi:hypothetical protein [Tunicatimonas pelagia]|uniref:hypothetical protein n=1 Tax=Tunicatimonas pelagia TaxID=931531 RepID=UPI0026654659|nr:hypothetical protein [Tunicatimonas pelagia]WKN45062.1 hypothetical protein P0M28_08800 [Tunicatimonas pelagia]